MEGQVFGSPGSPLGKQLIDAKPKAAMLHSEATGAFFQKCPFCGNCVNVFQVPEDRYGESAPYGWTLECMNMGCIFTRPSPDQSLKHLAERWNRRF